MTQSVTRRGMIAGLGAVAVLLALVTDIHSAPLGAEAALPLDELWLDLEKGELEASRALLKLAARPKEAVVFLKSKMKPLKIDSKKVDGLLNDLGSDKEETWKPAFEELEYFDPRLAIDLQTLMANVTEAPARQRMVALLSEHAVNPLMGKKIKLRALNNGEGFNFSSDDGSWWAEHLVARLNQPPGGSPKKKWTRATRAIVLLEHIGTPEALAILKEMATGHEEAGPTVSAKEACMRMSKNSR